MTERRTTPAAATILARPGWLSLVPVSPVSVRDDRLSFGWEHTVVPAQLTDLLEL